MSGATRRSYWRCSKTDFFPESSFENFKTYRKAVSKTFPRLKDRILSRSSDAQELIECRRESENEMKRCLTWWDLTWLSFGSVVGSGIFTITGLEAHNDAGPGIVLAYVISGFSALLSVFCYTEFAVEIPVAGGSFSFLRIELGDFVAFIAAGNIMLESVVGAAGLGRAWSSYFGSIIKDNPEFLRFHVKSLPEGFNMIDPVGMAVLLAACAFAMSGTRRTSILNWLSSILTAIVIVGVIVIGFMHGNTDNLHPFFPFGPKGVFQAASVVYWSYTGFDMVATMAEETKNPSTDIPIGLVGSMTIITVIYCLMSLVLVMMQKYTAIDVDAPYAVAFEAIGMKWAKYVVSLIALKGMTTSLLVGSLGQARYVTQIGRTHMIPPWFALVHPKTGTPINAALFISILAGSLSLFTSLDVLSSVFSFSTLFIFMLMAVALLVRRYYVTNDTPKKDSFRFLACLSVILASSIGLTIFWQKGSGWIGYAVSGAILFLSTLAMQLIPQRRSAKIWGVPLVPWLPSLSIFINIFLIGSLGAAAVWRFVVCTAVMMLYYLLAGVHATYDVAHQNKAPLAIEEGKAGGVINGTS